ncbi:MULTISPECIES: secretin N-terminal domain-containing protein [unclassified Gilliamella]|uniref:secretin N-terminal domain-containing protein n=1 Tax=unclassified Gilliamella TaxID=2685620 RepID=UPI0018DE0A45|nr:MULTISPECIES: secretin N-terminal domain-containing protein [unclassified Gilliamella]MBI0112916.1 type IV pilus secretin PilQ [Gilliamella sp. W8123]MBI0118307.1 type IV pilus secretin PilQ [Gilliamella sp. W8129]
MFKISQILKKSAKKYLNIIILAILFSMSCWANPKTLSSAESDDLVSINFYQTDIAIILQALADNKQMNLVMVDDLSTKQTIKLQNVTWQKALTVVLNSANLRAEIDDNILFISKADDPEELLQKKLLEQKELQLNEPLTLLTIPVNHADLSNLVETIQSQGLLSERGKAIIDKRTNSIIITDMSKQFSNIKKLVKSLDQPIPQVHISAHIVTMNKQSMDELGIKWGYTGHSSQVLSKFDVDFGVTNAASSVGFNLAKLSGSLLNLELSALESENQLEIIASPNLLTANQNMASIKQGTEIPYEVSNGGNGSTSIEFKQAVLGLEVTPKIIANDQMILDLYITQNTAGRSIKRRDGGEALAIETQEIRTQVKIKSGETVVLGGIFQQINNVSKNSVPGISNIPIIGNAFKNKAKKQQKRELVIFITPQLVE